MGLYVQPFDDILGGPILYTILVDLGVTKEEVHFAVQAYTAMVNVCILEIRTGGPFILLYVVLYDLVRCGLIFILGQHAATNYNEFITVVCESDLIMWMLKNRHRHFLDIFMSSAYVSTLNPRNLVISNTETDSFTLSIDDFEFLKAVSDGCRVHEENREWGAV